MTDREFIELTRQIKEGSPRKLYSVECPEGVAKLFKEVKEPEIIPGIEVTHVDFSIFYPLG